MDEDLKGVMEFVSSSILCRKGGLYYKHCTRDLGTGVNGPDL